MPDHADLKRLARSAKGRRADLLRQLALPEEELTGWCAEEVPILLEAFSLQLRMSGLGIAADGSEAEEFTTILASCMCAAFDTGFEVGAALGVEKLGR
jgi:hypothetical protein